MSEFNKWFSKNGAKNSSLPALEDKYKTSKEAWLACKKLIVKEIKKTDLNSTNPTGYLWLMEWLKKL